MRVTVGVEQALRGRDHQPSAVAVDRAAFQHPIAAFDALVPLAGQPRTDIVVPFQIVFPAPAVEGEVHRDAVAADDRPGIAQPDVAERLHHHLCERRQRTRGRGGVGVGGYQDHGFPRAIGINRGGEGGDLLLRGLQVLLPKVGVAGKTDPHRLVRCPFGGGVEHQAAPLLESIAAVLTPAPDRRKRRLARKKRINTVTENVRVNA